jgi:hypothetical protein
MCGVRQITVNAGATAACVRRRIPEIAHLVSQ